jgi:hypothetical protein
MTEETPQVGPNPEVTITLRVNEINIILAGLQELPFKVAEPLIKNIIAQAQNNLAQEAVAEAATEA